MGDVRQTVDYTLPIPLPSPDHQQRITRQKWFEIGAVALLIAAGAGYLVWRDVRSQTTADNSVSLTASAEVIKQAGGHASGGTVLLNRHFQTFRQELTIFDCQVALIGEGTEDPLETAVIWLTPVPDKWAPTAEAMQGAVNSVASLAQKLVRSAGDALEKASKTMIYVSDTKRPHDKGVAGTSDGWKITYVTYRSANEGAAPEPALYLVLQRLSAGSNPDLAVFNRTLYEAIEQGDDIETVLRGASASPPPG
ncbi:MAG: hypothetical protein HZB26_14945 [Candidatus Hydrogenedentes bacterium]|nr:hypothetical protein [Candidatus Hydrogenedentota bacterium]